MAACVCGYTHAHIPHACWKDDIKPGVRCEPKPRCVCGTLHAHIEHACPGPRKPKNPKVPFIDRPETLELANKQWAEGWRPKDMCLACPSVMQPCKGCYIRAGYSVETYEARFAPSPTSC